VLVSGVRHYARPKEVQEGNLRASRSVEVQEGNLRASRSVEVQEGNLRYFVARLRFTRRPPRKAQRSCVDKQSLHGVAHKKSCQDE